MKVAGLQAGITAGRYDRFAIPHPSNWGRRNGQSALIWEGQSKHRRDCSGVGEIQKRKRLYWNTTQDGECRVEARHRWRQPADADNYSSFGAHSQSISRASKLRGLFWPPGPSNECVAGNSSIFGSFTSKRVQQQFCRDLPLA